MRSAQLLIAFFGYLTLFAAAAPAQHSSLGVVNGTSTEVGQQRPDSQEHQSIGELLLGGHTGLSVPELTVSHNPAAHDTDASVGSLARRAKKKTTKKPKATKKKTPKKPKKPKTAKKPKKPKAAKKPKTTKKPKKPKATKTSAGSKPTACSRNHRRNEEDCDQSTAAYKVVQKAATKAKVTLREGKSYAMIQKPASGMINHHRLIVAKVIKTGDKLDIDAKMTELRKGAEGNPISGAETDQFPKDSWSCDQNASSNKYKLKGEVTESYELFTDVQQKGDALILAGGKYNVLTNNCQTFAKDLAKAIT